MGLALPASRTQNLAADARVVLKSSYAELVREIPCQIYDVATTAGTTTCRIAFYSDLPGNSLLRFAVFYDNPKAVRADPAGLVRLVESNAGLSVEAPAYSAVFDPRTAQCLRLQSRVPRPQPIADRGASFPLPLVSILTGGPEGDRVQLLRPAAATKPDRRVAGPVFTSLRGARDLIDAQGSAWARADFVYLFYGNEPYLIVKTSLTFLRDAPVYTVEMNPLAADQAQLTHFMFRPVSPQFPLTEAEEVGSLMVDVASRQGFPDGDMLAGMIPADLAWQSWVNIDRGFAMTAFALSQRQSSPRGNAPRYRAATLAAVREGQIESAIAPIFMATRDPQADPVPVPAGTTYEQAQAVYFSDWNATGWRRETDLVGRRLNSRPEIKIYPRRRGAAGRIRRGAPSWRGT